MKNEVATTTQTEKGLMSMDDINVLIQAGILPKGVPTSQVKVFASICKERGLSPFSKEIYLTGYRMKDGTVNYATIVGIDGYRKIAKADLSYAGTDDVKFNVKSDGSFKTATDIILETPKGHKALPISATITVWKMVEGNRISFTHTAIFSEFDGKVQKWITMPFQMISKVAESFALKKAFSISGVSIPEEIAAFQQEPQQTELSELDLQDIKAVIDQCNNREDFKKALKENPLWRSNMEVLEMMELRNKELQND